MDRFTARRRLLRGSLSAPLVLTVASPAALAQANTSFAACLARADGIEGEVYVGPDSMDNLVRQEVKVYKFVAKAVDPPADPPANPPVNPPGRPFIANSGNPVVDSAGGSPPNPPASPPANPPASPPGELHRNDLVDQLFEKIEGRYFNIATHDELRDLPDGLVEKEAGSRWKLVYFDRDGTIVGSGLVNPHNGSATTNSCLASFT